GDRGHGVLPLQPAAVAQRSGRRARRLRRGGARLPRRLRIPREALAARDARDLHPRHQALRGRACAAQRALRDGYAVARGAAALEPLQPLDRKSTRLNSSHLGISYAVFCLKKKKKKKKTTTKTKQTATT